MKSRRTSDMKFARSNFAVSRILVYMKDNSGKAARMAWEVGSTPLIKESC
jgi:hypothetical protein